MKCVICGTTLPDGSERCSICNTEFSRNGTVKIDLKKRIEESKPLTPEGLGLKRLKKDIPSPKGKKWEDIIADLEKEYGRDDDGVLRVPETKYDEDALRELMLIPGVSREQAKLLYDIGYTSLEGVLLGALHGYDDAETLAKILALKIKTGKKEEISQIRVRCTSCKTLVRISQERCPVCNAPIGDIAITEDDAKKRIEEHAGNILKAVSEDAFFRGISPEMKKDIIREMKDLLPDEVKRREKIKEAWIAKLQLWKSRGFAVDELRDLLEKDFDKFLERTKGVLSPEGMRISSSESKYPGWCTHCGERWTPGRDECTKCGKALTSMKRCGSCGIPLKPAMRKCPACKKEVNSQ
jgi:hypothetical protein